MEVTMRLTIFFVLTAMFTICRPDEIKEAVVGEDARLECRKGVNGSQNWLEWRHKLNKNPFKFIYKGNKIETPYMSRFSVTRDDTIGQYDLVISNVTLEDAGRYSCEIDGSNLSTELIVFEKYPSDKFCWIHQPSSVLDSNGCVNDSTPTDMSCNISYRGSSSIVPSLQWRRGEEAIVQSNRSTISTIRTSWTVKDSISCQIIYQSDMGALHNPKPKKWTPSAAVTTPNFNIVTVDGSQDKTVTCDTKPSYNCSYWWVDEGNNKVSKCFTLEIPQMENKTYSCLATCGQSQPHVLKRVSPVTLELVATTSQPNEDGNRKTIIALALAVSVFCVAIIALIAYVLRRRRQQQSHHDHTVNATETTTMTMM